MSLVRETPVYSGETPTIAITGASGLIGRSLVPLLLQSGYRLRLLTRRPMERLEGVTFVEGSMADAASLRNLVQQTAAVIHLAGIAHTSLRSEQESQAAWDVNVGGARRLLHSVLSIESGAPRVLLVSSAHVYSRQSGMDLHESSPVGGDRGYAEMKLEVEAAAREAAAQKADIVVIRPCITYGAGVKFNLRSLMNAIDGGYYFHVGGADPIRSLLSVKTAAAAIVHLLQSGQSGSIYNVADRTPVHLAAWVNALAARMGVSRPRTLPIGILKPTAAVLTLVNKAGLPVPLTSESLAKLTASFSLDITALARTGFIWPETDDEVLDAMVAAFRESRQRHS